MKKLFLTLGLAIGLLSTSGFGGTVNVPKDDAAVTITVPDLWKAEETAHGFACESPDQAATLFFEVIDAKKIDALIDDNIDWLVKEQKIAIDKTTQQASERESNGLSWKMLTWDGKNDEFGPATITLAFANVGRGKTLMSTYWVTKKGEKTHAAELDTIFQSVKKISE